ncbi:MAG TPA: BON domain-containing protein [Herpetosiphonaceae bacterium]|nr:BON domain-containing protein [Herpetosiphonaceae bacterium]
MNVLTTEAGAGRRAELRIGSPVRCLDGEAGRLERVIFSPRRGLVTHLVVRRGFLGHQDRVVPLSHVTGSTDEAVELDLALAALQQFPVYDPSAYTTSAPDRQAARGYSSEEMIVSLGGATADLQSRPAERSGVLEPRDEDDQTIAVVSEGMEVVFRDPVLRRHGKVGQVGLVLLDRQTHHATHIVVRRGWPGALWSKRDMVVPLDWATEITPKRITLEADPWQLEQLPEYRPDDEIAEDVRQALYDAPVFHEGADFFSMRVAVRDGVVELSGNVRNSTRRWEAELIARRVPGVLDVRNELIADDALELEVERTLRHDERLQVKDLRAEAILGLVRLRGRVPTLEQRELAAQIVRHVMGVQAVNNALRIDSAPDRTATVPVDERVQVRE